MTTFEELKRLNGPKGGLSSIFEKVWEVTKNGIKLGLVIAVFSQCGAMSIMADKVTKLENRPAVAQFGDEKTLFVGDVVSEAENVEMFIKESLPLLYTVSLYAPKDSDPECAKDPDCSEALTDGMDIAGVSGVPTVPAMSSFLLSSDYQRPFLKTIVDMKPKGFERGASLVYRVNNIDVPKEIEGGYEVYVIGSLFGFDEKQRPLKGIRDDKIVTLRRVEKPTEQDGITKLNKLVNGTRSRGWEITQIISVELPEN